MKKTFVAIVVAIIALISITAAAERKIWMYSNTGNHLSMDVTDLDSVSFEEPALLILSEYNKNLNSKGGSFNLGIQANQAWKAETNNPDALSLSKTTGTGDENITVTATENTGTDSYSAIVTVTLLNGEYKQLVVTVLGIEDSYLYLSPETKNTSSDGGRFTLDISTNQNWIADVSNHSILTLSEEHGTGNSTIYVYVASNKNVEPLTESVTVKLEDGTEKKLIINTSINDEYVYSDIEGVRVIEKEGGSFKVNVSSNTIWFVECYDPLVTITPTSGKYNGTITINAEANPNGYNEYATLTFTAIGGANSENTIMIEGDKVSVKPKAQTVAALGGSYKIGITSNTDWSVSASDPWVTFDKASGSLNDSILVFVGKGDNDAAKASIIVTTINGKTARCTVKHEEDKISTLTSSEMFPFEGGNITVPVSSNTEWIVSSDKSWVTTSQSTGSGDDSVNIYVNVGMIKSQQDTAKVTFTTSHGKVATINIYRSGYTGSGDAVTDVNGRSYPTVWINGQNWMAENLKCNRYDTQSEAYKAVWLINDTLPTLSMGWINYTPGYIDATEKSKWCDKIYSGYSGNLSSEQISKLGYLYTWAAAVGVVNGYNYDDTPFSGNRQGICPNGWHIPTKVELQTLVDYIHNAQESDDEGIYLKTTSGWYDDDNPEEYPQGSDTYGFAVLPSGGIGMLSCAERIGEVAEFWTVTSDSSDDAWVMSFIYWSTCASIHCEEKYYNASVRCVKD